jgi:ferritin-like metal-binding protein YciE
LVDYIRDAHAMETTSLQMPGGSRGDPKTSEIARRNLADEEKMAKKIASSWDKVIDLTLEESVDA